ncbi:hypothetical protein CgunFtcFv8_027759 [Champsocephalus gunnari]|uniref:Uncharacterized protein n=1 Tax=Champsocephalus gunnari TaxID=52237 RepID=A0AAN8E794_CHAGU|nr:hypothetical protein CgunFtcFv8_027759 [Champsocephalus gunnari]
MALISLEDLEGLDEEQLDDDITEDPQPMAEEEEDRLLTHWQAVASTHQVLVPPEMMGPIMEMTRNSQQRELLQFSSICCHEKMGEVQFEERLIPPGQWACVSAGEKLFEQSVSVSFMKLMRYICRENSTGRFLGLTVPVVTEVSADGLSMQEVVRTSFFLPSEFQSDPPLPSDPDITIVQREPIRVLSRTFSGTTTWQTLTYQVGILRGLLGAPPSAGKLHGGFLREPISSRAQERDLDPPMRLVDAFPACTAPGFKPHPPPLLSDHEASLGVADAPLVLPQYLNGRDVSRHSHISVLIGCHSASADVSLA